MLTACEQATCKEVQLLQELQWLKKNEDSYTISVCGHGRGTVSRLQIGWLQHSERSWKLVNESRRNDSDCLDVDMSRDCVYCLSALHSRLNDPVWRRQARAMSYRTLTRIIIISGMLLVVGDMVGFLLAKHRSGGPTGAPMPVYKKYRKIKHVKWLCFGITSHAGYTALMRLLMHLSMC